MDAFAAHCGVFILGVLCGGVFVIWRMTREQDKREGEILKRLEGKEKAVPVDLDDL